MSALIICVMGVAGAGKSAIGKLLASQLHCAFLDAGTLHPAVNIQKMSRGAPLTDADRAPWLAAVHACIARSLHRREDLIVACSALKRRYRDTIGYGLPVVWVYLKGSEDLIRAHLLRRQHHFMKAQMLARQFADLEEPANAIAIDVAVEPLLAVRQILKSVQAAESKAS